MFLKLSLCVVGLLLVGLLSYGAEYVIGPGSLHGGYLFSCDWHNWGLTAQPMTLTIVTDYGPPVPRKHITPKVIEWGRVVQVGPMSILHCN